MSKKIRNLLFGNRILILIALLFISSTPLVQAHQDDTPFRYVAPDGVDEGDCHTPERPCQTLLYAINQAAKGDTVLVAGGTYSFDPEEAVLLLSDIVPVQGGYETDTAFALQAPEASLSYITGLPFEFREQLAERGFTLLQDPKALDIELSIQERSQLGFQPSAVVETPASCVAGLAGIYPCEDIDLLGNIALNEFSSNPSSANDIWGYVDLDDNREYAILGLHNGTAVVDVTDPTNPVEVGTIPGASSMWRDVKVLQIRNEAENRWDAYAYVTTEAIQGLQIIDLSNLPASISLAATYNAFASAHNIYLGNIDYSTGRALPGLTAYAYIAGSNLDTGAFRVLDLTDPTTLVEVTAPPIGTGYVHDATNLTITDSRTAACSAGHNPCEIFVDFNETTVDLWDVTDKSAPFKISATPYTNSSYTHSGWWSEDKMFLFIQDELDEQDHGLNTTLRTLDISDLAAPFTSHEWTGSSRAIDHNGFVKGDRYYMSNYRRGLTVLDIANPNDPQEIAFFDTFPTNDNPNFNGAWGAYPYLPSGNILVSDIEGGLFVLREQTEPPPPPIVGSGVLGYAWANNPTANSYTPSTTYSFNSSGGPISITRNSTGRYAVRFDGLGGSGTYGAHVQVTPYGSGPETCKIRNWSSGGDDIVINVNCFNASGNPIDVRYTVLVVW